MTRTIRPNEKKLSSWEKTEVSSQSSRDLLFNPCYWTSFRFLENSLWS